MSTPVDTEQRRTVPPPVRVGIGLVAAGLDRARRMSAADVATRGLVLIATARERAERTYEELANRGETVIARWRGRPEPRQNAPVPEARTEPRTTPRAQPRPEPTAAAAVILPDAVATAVESATPGATLSHDELPLDDFDHLTLGSLRARLPRLDAVALVQLLDYERVHANRLPVLTMLENRIAKVTSTP